MCGLGGIWVKAETELGGAFARLEAALAQRGPDGGARFRDESFGMVHRKLGIVARKTAASITRVPGSKLAMVGSGTILNYHELRADLPQRLRPSHEAGDMAVALALFTHLGWRGFARLRGPFALAIWDPEERELWLCRDYLGRAPLYLYDIDGKRVFGSMLRAVQWALSGALPLDSESLVEYFALGHCAPHRTLFAGVFPVEPGTALRLTAAGRHCYRFHQWQRSERERWTVRDWHTSLENALETAVERALCADRAPVLALSGGIDSTSLLTLIAEKLGRLKVLTLAHQNDSDPSIERARAVCEPYDCEHLVKRASTPSLEAVWKLLSERVDAPAGSAIVLHNDDLHRAAARESRVLLAGHGADELLAGYGRYRRFCRVSLAGDVSYNTGSGPQVGADWPRFERLVRFRRLAHRYLHRELLDCSRNSLREVLAGITRCAPRREDFDIARTLDLFWFNAWGNLRLPDENGLANGVETRSPFFDADFVELAYSAPIQVLLFKGRRKAVLLSRLDRCYPRLWFGGVKFGFDSPFRPRSWVVRHRSAILALTAETARFLAPDFRRLLWSDATAFADNWRIGWRLLALSAWMSGTGAEATIAPNREAWTNLGLTSTC